MKIQRQTINIKVLYGNILHDILSHCEEVPESTVIRREITTALSIVQASFSNTWIWETDTDASSDIISEEDIDIILKTPLAWDKSQRYPLARLIEQYLVSYALQSFATAEAKPLYIQRCADIMHNILVIKQKRIKPVLSLEEYTPTPTPQTSYYIWNDDVVPQSAVNYIIDANKNKTSFKAEGYWSVAVPVGMKIAIEDDYKTNILTINIDGTWSADVGLAPDYNAGYLTTETLTVGEKQYKVFHCTHLNTAVIMTITKK